MEKVNDTTKVGSDVLNNLGTMLLLLYADVFILVDSNTHKHCLPQVLNHLPDQLEVHILEVPAGEESKQLSVAGDLWRQLKEKGASRSTMLINVGGGMITDLGGFVASTYMRGIDFINIPTSLLGMVDASIGGKTGIDVEGAKNMVGTFEHAQFTLIHPPFLETLPKRELVAGFAEVVKHGLLTSEERLLQFLRSWKAGEFESLILEAARIKWRIVEEDFEEEGIRKTLNFGHTLGHAVESHFLTKNHSILHGEAIAAGMLMESWLSVQLAGLSKQAYLQIEGIILNEFPVLRWPEEDDDQILKWLRFDKKNAGAEQQYALLEDMGHCTHSHEVSIDLSAAALAHYRNLVGGE